MWNLVFIDEKHGVGAIMAITDALCQASKFIGSGSWPGWAGVGVAHELAVIEFVTAVIKNGGGDVGVKWVAGVGEVGRG